MLTSEVWQAAKNASMDMEDWLAMPSEATCAAMASDTKLATRPSKDLSSTPELAGRASSMKSRTCICAHLAQQLHGLLQKAVQSGP